LDWFSGLTHITGNTAPSTSPDRSEAQRWTIEENGARGAVHVASTAGISNGATVRKAARDTALLITTVSRSPCGRESNSSTNLIIRSVEGQRQIQGFNADQIGFFLQIPFALASTFIFLNSIK
jgi:hypothetical protein